MEHVLFKLKEFDNSIYRFCLGSALVKNNNRTTPIHRKHALILLKNTSSDISIVHPLTAFIFWKWKYKSYNTQRLQATHLCQFLNYILITHQSNFKLKSLQDLKFEHATNFLNDLLKDKRTNATVKNIERTLLQFYKFLAVKKCSKQFSIDDFTKTNNPKENKNYTISPFKVRYSNSSSNARYTDMKVIEHTLPIKYILPFLRTSIHTAPSIALAIYFSIFGGLRIGEVVNITLKDITPYGDIHGKGGIKISLNSRSLRSDIQDTSGTTYVKKSRLQFVYNIKNILPIIYSEHLKILKKHLNISNLPVNTPLFINRDRKAMTGKSMRYHFEKVKKNFINELGKSTNSDDIITSLNLMSTKWSFHIGRGTFTNLIAKVANNPYEIALSRGDSSIFSALTYMADSNELKYSIEKILDDMFNTESQ